MIEIKGEWGRKVDVTGVNPDNQGWSEVGRDETVRDGVLWALGLEGGDEQILIPSLGKTLAIPDIASAFNSSVQLRAFMTWLVESAKANPDILKSMWELLQAVEIYTTESGFKDEIESKMRMDVVRSFSLSKFAETKWSSVSKLTKEELFTYWDTIISMSSQERITRWSQEVIWINNGWWVWSANLWPLTWKLAGKMSQAATTEKYGHLAGINGNTPDQVIKALRDMTDPVCIFELLLWEAWEDIPESFLEAMFQDNSNWNNDLWVKTNVAGILSLIVWNS
jgi:hypothetical protein